MKLILLGYMGSGKTMVGKQLAKTLNHSFLDLDELIEKQEGSTISQLFSDKGEIYFRKKETEALLDLLQSDSSLIVATGGGTPCYGSNMDAMLSHEKVITIYLKASLSTLTERLFKEKDKRPLIDHIKSKDELQDFIGKHLFERAPIYERSQIIINTNDLTGSEVIARIIAQLF